MLKKKIWANFQRTIDLFPQKMSLSSQNKGLGFGIRDPGSGKNLFRIPDPGSGTLPLIMDPDPGGPKPYGSANLLQSKQNTLSHLHKHFALILIPLEP